MGQWSELPADLSMMIQQLSSIPDKIRFRCVCKNWHYSTLPAGLPDLRHPQPPWLLLPYSSGSLCGLYHPLEKKEYDIDLSEAGEKVFKGSGHGWVVTMQLDGSINVVNPLTRIRIPLPPRYTFPDVTAYRPNNLGKEYLLETLSGHSYTSSSEKVRSRHTTKIALSCSPTWDDFVAVALYDYPITSRLAYCKIGDEKWRDVVDFDSSHWFYRDVTFLDGKLYAISHDSQPSTDLVVCDDIASRPKLTKCAPLPASIGMHNSPYVNLINSSRGLMLLKTGVRSRINENMVEFKIFRFNRDSWSWIGIPIESMDDEILFVGLGIGIGVSSQNFRGSNGSQIYFARVPSDLGHTYDWFDNIVYNIDDRSTKPLVYECNVPEICHFPIWVTPNPY